MQPEHRSHLCAREPRYSNACATANIPRGNFTLEAMYRCLASRESTCVLENPMRKLAVAMLAVAGLISGCIAYEVPGRGGGARPGDRDRDGVPNRVDRDRDGDGVPNRQDSRPNDPRRY